MKNLQLTFLLLTLALSSYAQNDEPIPFANFSEIVINLAMPQFRALNADGGFVEIDGGLRGIIIYRENEEKYIAYERNCSFHPGESCARIDPDISRLFMIDPCCGSRFNFSDGYPSKGPASRPLQKYSTHLSGKTLTVTDEVVF